MFFTAVAAAAAEMDIEIFLKFNLIAVQFAQGILMRKADHACFFIQKIRFRIG